jgi:hypothetical protein
MLKKPFFYHNILYCIGKNELFVVNYFRNVVFLLFYFKKYKKLSDALKKKKILKKKKDL